MLHRSPCGPLKNKIVELLGLQRFRVCGDDRADDLEGLWKGTVNERPEIQDGGHIIAPL